MLTSEIQATKESQDTFVLPEVMCRSTNLPAPANSISLCSCQLSAGNSNWLVPFLAFSRSFIFLKRSTGLVAPLLPCWLIRRPAEYNVHIARPGALRNPVLEITPSIATLWKPKQKNSIAGRIKLIAGGWGHRHLRSRQLLCSFVLHIFRTQCIALVRQQQWKCCAWRPKLRSPKSSWGKPRVLVGGEVELFGGKMIISFCAIYPVQW